MIRIRTIIGLATAAALAAGTWASAQGATPAGEPDKGKAVFAICAGCHVLSGPSFTAPALAGVVGRRAGTAPGFEYTQALIGSGLVWNAETLDRFLADPSKAVPGTAMFNSVPDAQDRADVIAYLKTVPAPAAP